MLPLLFFSAAFLYSLVGFAGGSSYLLILALAGVSQALIPSTALVCNLAVSSVAFYHFSKAGHFNFKRTLPFIMLSIPMAFLGAKINLPRELFFILLGISLMAASLRIFITQKDLEIKGSIASMEMWGVGLPVGAGIGFFSGFLGIGGGIFLTPLLMLMRWMSAKEAAATVSFFIFVNSLSGLLARFQNGFTGHPDILMLALAALAGGTIGSMIGSERLSVRYFQKALATLLLYVSVNLLMKAF